MGIEPDTFLGFIDDLAADLDDHESSAEERAARLLPVAGRTSIG